MKDRSPGRPGVLNTVAIVSLLGSIVNVVWVVLLGVIVAFVGAASWLGGPVLGLPVTVVAGVLIVVLLAHSILSILLFIAGWKTWTGEPGGRPLHLAWAWIIVVIDVIDLVFTGGIDPGAWVRLIYAAIVILVMRRDDVRAYFDRHRRGPATAYQRDDWA